MMPRRGLTGPRASRLSSAAMMPERRARLPLPYDREAAERLAARFAELLRGGAGASPPARRGRRCSRRSAATARSCPISRCGSRRRCSMRWRGAGRMRPWRTRWAACAASIRARGRDAVGAALRVAKRRVALIAAAADIAGRWPLDRVTGALSAMAEAAVGLACAHLLGAAIGRGELRPFPLDRWADAEAGGLAGSGLCVLGMGKLGGAGAELLLRYRPHAALRPARGSLPRGPRRRLLCPDRRATWCGSWRSAPPTVTSSAPISASARTRRRRRWPSPCTPRSPTTSPWARIGSGRR